MGCEPFPEFEHGWTNAESIHEDENGRPGTVSRWAIHVARAHPISGLDFNFAHQHILAKVRLKTESSSTLTTMAPTEARMPSIFPGQCVLPRGMVVPVAGRRAQRDHARN